MANVNTIAALQLYNGTDNQAEVLGYNSAYDGGGGTFYWFAGSSLTTDNGFVFDSSTTLTSGPHQYGTGKWVRQEYFEENSHVNVQWFGTNSTDYSSITVAAISAAVSMNRTLIFTGGTFNYTSTLNFAASSANQGLRVEGLGDVTLNFTLSSSGKGVTFNAGTNNYYNFTFKNFTITGNTNTTDGLYCTGVHHSIFENIRIRGAATNGVNIEFAVCNRYSELIISNNEGTIYPIPAVGIRIADNSSNAFTTDCCFINCIVEDLASSTGILIENGTCNTFLGGTSEGNNYGLQIDTGCDNNTFINMFMELNFNASTFTGGDIICSAKSNRFINCTANSRGVSSPGHNYWDIKGLTYKAGSQLNEFSGGVIYAASIESGALSNSIYQTDLGYKVFDSGTDSIFIANRWLYQSSAILKSVLPIQNAFVSLTASSNWPAISGFAAPSFAKNVSTKEVVVQGVVGNTTVPSDHNMAQIPYTDCYPAYPCFFTCASTVTGNAPAQVTVNTSGQIIWLSGSQTSIDLSAIRFFVS